jgi:hypothetical protein
MLNRARFRLAGVSLVRRFLVELLRRESGVEHCVARLFDESRHIDAHGADQAAATAHVAAIEQQVLPLPQLVSGDLTLQAQQSI